MTSERDSDRELLMRAAIKLFAAFGYDGTSLQQIADTAGFDLATVEEIVGHKRDLYLAVVRRLFEQERAAREAVMTQFSTETPEKTVESLHRLLDDYTEYTLSNPERTQLWVHRSLLDAADLAELEEQFIQPILQMVLEGVQPALEKGYMDPEVDLELGLWTVIWMVQGITTQATVMGHIPGPPDAWLLERFKRHLHLLIDRLFRLPGTS
ncbi:helix-turn-helix domain-containing protein [Sphaerisporangium sp. NPDC005288]|uniref:TetR/AcrR family transcriptional regulator n=1 Tax=Sphaerisporangium sp. NPDC005288 TaxID=3155114 RepID=UPI0033B694C0